MRLILYVVFFSVGYACTSAQNWGNVTGPFVRREVEASAIRDQVVTRWVQFNRVIYFYAIEKAP